MHRRFSKRILHNRLLHFFLIAIAGLLVYSNTFQAPFHFDDFPFIVDNPAIRDFSYLLNPSKVDTLDIRPDAKRYFRTRYVGYLSLWANYRLGGLDVKGYHLGNIIIHIINSLLVYLLVALIFKFPLLNKSRLKEKSELVALFSGLFFAVHPVQTEAITYILQRTALLSAMFYIFSTLAYAWSRLSSNKVSSWTLYALAIISALLGMKSKENALTLPITIVIFEFMFLRGRIKMRALRLIPFLLTMLLIPLTHISLSMGKSLSEILNRAMPVPGSISKSDYLFTQFRAITSYLRILVFPINQNVDHDISISHSFFDPAVVPSFVLLLFIFAFGVYFFHRSRITNSSSTIHSPLTTDSSSCLVAFGIFWFFITLSVESSFMPIVEIMVEYRVYLPSAGLLIATTVLFFSILDIIKKRRDFLGNALLSMFLLMIIGLAFAAHSRNSIWKDDVSLWKDSVSKSPNKTRALLGLGSAYLHEGHVDKAIEYFNAMLGLDPNSQKAFLNLGNAYMAKDMADKAIECYQRSLALDPTSEKAHFNLGNAYRDNGVLDMAIKHYKSAIRINPNHAMAHNNLGALYLDKGNMYKAIEHLHTAVVLLPDYAVAYNNLGKAYQAMGKEKEAIDHYERAIGLKADLVSPHISLGIIYKSKGLLEKAIEHYRQALSINSDNPDVHYNIGNAYMIMGLTDMAIEHYGQAINLRPDNPDAHYNLGMAYQQKGIMDKAEKELRISENLRRDQMR